MCVLDYVLCQIVSNVRVLCTTVKDILCVCVHTIEITYTYVTVSNKSLFGDGTRVCFSWQYTHTHSIFFVHTSVAVCVCVCVCACLFPLSFTRFVVKSSCEYNKGCSYLNWSVCHNLRYIQVCIFASINVLLSFYSRCSRILLHLAFITQL